MFPAYCIIFLPIKDIPLFHLITSHSFMPSANLGEKNEVHWNTPIRYSPNFVRLRVKKMNFSYKREISLRIRGRGVRKSLTHADWGEGVSKIAKKYWRHKWTAPNESLSSNCNLDGTSQLDLSLVIISLTNLDKHWINLLEYQVVDLLTTFTASF